MDTFLSSDTLISPTLCFYLLQYQLVRSRASFSRFCSTWTFCNCSALKSPSVSLLALGKIMLIICHVAILIQYILLLNLNLNLSCKVGLTGLTFFFFFRVNFIVHRGGAPCRTLHYSRLPTAPWAIYT